MTDEGYRFPPREMPAWLKKARGRVMDSMNEGMAEAEQEGGDIGPELFLCQVLADLGYSTGKRLRMDEAPDEVCQAAADMLSSAASLGFNAGLQAGGMAKQ